VHRVRAQDRVLVVMLGAVEPQPPMKLPIREPRTRREFHDGRV
jgi:hypothetical protein